MAVGASATPWFVSGVRFDEKSRVLAVDIDSP